MKIGVTTATVFLPQEHQMPTISTKDYLLDQAIATNHARRPC